MKPLNIAIYESLSHFIPTGVGWYEGFFNLGHAPSILQSQHNLNLFEIDQPDLLVIMDNVSAEDVIRFKGGNPNTKIVMVFFEYKDFFPQLKGVVDAWIMIAMQHDAMRKKFDEAGLPLIFVPLAASKNKFYKTQTPKIYETSFIGQFGATGHGYREQDKYLFPVINREYKGYYAGFNYKDKTYPTIHHDFINTIYNQTHINLNFHYSYQKKQIDGDFLHRLDFNGRVYEIALSGNFQLCDHPLIYDIFECSIKYSTPEHWLDDIDWFLSNPNTAQNMADEARNICLESHTWDKRMEQLLNKLF